MSHYWNRKLIREQLDSKLNVLKSFSPHMPEGGWIKVLREALGMSTKQLARKVGIDQSRISRLENAEPAGDLKLSSLKKIAEALDMDFVYAFVPRESLEATVRNQARKTAAKRLDRLSHTMRLEQQELTAEEKEKALEHMVDRIFIEDPKGLWNQ